MTIRRFLLQISDKRANFEQWDNRTRAANTIDFVEKEAIENEDEDMPFLVRHRRCWSFRNGYYAADGDRFIPYGAHVVLPEEQSCKYIPFDLSDYEPIQGDYKIDNGVYRDLKGKPIGLGADHKQRPLRKRWMDIRTPYMDRLLKDQGFSYLVGGNMCCARLHRVRRFAPCELAHFPLSPRK
jgi:hypothetical protein